MPDVLPSHVPDAVAIAGNAYSLHVLNGRSVFSSQRRAIQGVPNDDFHLRIPFGSRGVGRDFYSAQNIFTAIPNMLLPPPSLTTINLTGLWSSGSLRYGYIEEQDANGRWYKYLVGPTMIVKLDITSNPPVVRQVYTLSTVSAFNANDRLGQPIKLPSGGVNYVYIPCNNGDRIVKLTIPVGVETTSAAFNPVVTLNGGITAAATSLVYTSGGDPIAAGDILLIDAEEIRVGAVDAGTNTCSSLFRAWAGTTAATHSDTAAITKKGGNDVFAALTTVVKGAAHFEQEASGRVYRATASHDALVFQNRAEVSLLAAGADPEVDANWADDFPVDSQTRWITALLAYSDQMFIHKQDGWYTATRLVDNTIKFQKLLPDDQFMEVAALGQETTHRGAIWHGNALLPSGNLWRSVVTSAIPLDPDSIESNETVNIYYVGGPVRYGRIPTVIGVGAWLYAPYPILGTNDSFLLAARENVQGTLDWFPLYYDGAGGTDHLGVQFVTVQSNGVGGPRVIYAIDTTIKMFSVAPDGNPAIIDNSASWDAQLGGTWTSRVISFDSNVHLREMEYVIDDPDINFLWGLSVYRNGGAEETVLSPVSGLGASGSIFWTRGTNDTCRRLRVRIHNNGAARVLTAVPPVLRDAVLHGTYLPDKSDEMQFVIDVEETAKRRGMSAKGVYDEVRALDSVGAVAWRDLYGQTGSILVRQTQEGAPESLKPLVGRPSITVNCTLIDYA